MKEVSSDVHAHGSDVTPYCGPEGPTATTEALLYQHAGMVSCGGSLGPRDLGGLEGTFQSCTMVPSRP